MRVRAISRSVLWGRVVLAALTSIAMTSASVVLVAALGAPEEPPAAQTAKVPAKTVPVVRPPEPSVPKRTAETSPTSASQQAASRADAVKKPPTVSPMVSAPLASSAGGPFSFAQLGSLPSVAGLPSSELPSDEDDEIVSPARATSRPPPSYPASAQRQGLEGSVTVRIRIDERGRVRDVVVVDSDPPGVFDTAARQAVRRYRFSPARTANRAVASTVQQTIRFELDR